MSSMQFRRGGMMNKGRSGTHLPPRQNVAVQIVRYDLDNVKKGSNPEKDALVGYLLHDVPEWGLTAEFNGPDEHGEYQPLTEVRVTMPLPKGVETSRRRDIYGLSRPKGAGPAMGEGSKVVFEKAWWDRKENCVRAHYAHGCATKDQLATGLKVVYPNMLVCVCPEKWIERGDFKGWAGRVDVLIADPSAADFVASAEDLGAKAADLVARNTIGNPGFMLLARAICPEGTDPAAFAADPNTRFGGYGIARRKKVEGTPEGEDAQWELETAEAMLERFNRDFNNEPFGQVIGNPGWQVEFVPLMAVNQAKSRVPSNKEHNERGQDFSPVYGIYSEVAAGDRDALHVVEGTDGRMFGMTDSGFMFSHTVAERRDPTSDVWYSTYQNGMAQRLDVFSIHDVPTALTPDYHAEAIKAGMAANVEAKKSYFAAKTEGSADTTEEALPGAEGPALGR